VEVQWQAKADVPTQAEAQQEGLRAGGEISLRTGLLVVLGIVGLALALVGLLFYHMTSDDRALREGIQEKNGLRVNGRADEVPKTSGTSAGVVLKDRIALDVSAKLVWAAIFRDGGSIVVELSDKAGKRLVFRLQPPWKTPPAVEILTRYENDGGFRVVEKYALEVGGVQEKALLKYLRDWEEKNLSKERRAKLAAVRALEGKDYDAWNKASGALTEEEMSAYRLLGVAEVLSKKR
jgi:hypothetical protein